MSFFTKTLLFLLLLSKGLLADGGSSHPKICLNMIVKDESEVIVRCLNSLLPMIDTYVIVDTGSTDGTQGVIENFFREHEIAGELYKRPWVDFSYNRNEAIQLSKGKGDYLLFIDADEYLDYEEGFELPNLDKDYYYITTRHSGTTYKNIQLVNNHLDWEYSGVLHEVICPPKSRSFAVLEKIFNVYTYDGNRSKNPRKYQQDVQILEQALEKEPYNDRYMFYLAQSYRDALEYSLALETYEKYLDLGSWDQEIFWALLQIAHLKEKLAMPFPDVIESYAKAFQYRTSRAEPLYYIAHFLRQSGSFFSAYHVAKIASQFSMPQEILFIQQWVYDYGILLELSICAYWIGKYEECKQICNDLLKKDCLPESVRTCVERNLVFARTKLKTNTIYQK